ncbi:atp2, beta subunit of the F1 sector of mitochondrial F1F0 ATP synthase [Mucor velutinosus]|uniref:Atp2, beta subunit of the F1 sector of mitochondrial F1F0 ATP synthase n=1 Tax=Mucor velutinosus TaxID=708070 RepID=A0AAN7DIX8_9FUNG|nr:atp2, beta subunit of the F1 sector of mitochondrial F1F0 ATP synthase [Mucor velutinosus]
MPKDVLNKYYPRSKLSQWKSPESQSPLDEDFRQEKNKIIFLVAGYAKYRCPYVWLRSHHEQLIRAQTGHIEEDDNPLQLQKTNEWKTSNVSLWEMVAEILLMTTNPRNPFQLDHDYINKLPVEESILLTGSLLAFLENVWIQADPSIAFLDDLHTEIQVLQSKHIENMYTYNLKNKN